MRAMPEEDEPPVEATVVGTAASLDPSGTTLIATVVAGPGRSGERRPAVRADLPGRPIGGSDATRS